MPILYPIHPRSKKMIKKFKVTIPKGIRLIKPMDYFTFLKTCRGARLILTDSGGVQEEACILKRPCVTLRENTERPETLKAGSNILAGTDPKKILECCGIMLKKKVNWKNPYGGGNSGSRILKIVCNYSAR